MTGRQALSPSQVILARCRAFVEGEFGFIYDSYHPESFFRRLYPDRQAYIDYGRTALSGDFQIRECRILREEITGNLARLIYYLDASFKGSRMESFEYCRLEKVGDQWLYAGTRKLERSEFPGPLEAIEWKDFDCVQSLEF